MKKYIFATIASLFMSMLFVGSASAVIFPPDPSELPTTVEDCKKDGWKNYNGLFKNQGDCVSFIATDGRNAPDGQLI